jgi:hypothetical protein
MYLRNSRLVLAGGNPTQWYLRLYVRVDPRTQHGGKPEVGTGRLGLTSNLWGPSDQLSLIGLDTKFGTIKSKMESGQTAVLPPTTVLRDRPSPAVLDGKGQRSRVRISSYVVAITRKPHTRSCRPDLLYIASPCKRRWRVLFRRCSS